MSEKRAKRKKAKELRVKCWAVTDCGELTSGASFSDTDLPLLIFRKEELFFAEARQNIILGKVIPITIVYREPKP